LPSFQILLGSKAFTVVPTVKAMAENIVSVENASLSFGKSNAINDLSFEIPEGKISVLLGPNGAGKTTTVRLITGALRCQRGEVRTFDMNPSGSEGEKVRHRIGIVSAKPALYDRATGRENLEYATKLYGMPKSLAKTAVQEASEIFRINDALDKKVGGYSTGMKTRLALARSILHGPKLLIYDEPTSGLDPESSQSVLELIRSMTLKGKTVLMCTHLLLEAEDLADQIIVLQAGHVTVRGSKEELIEKYFPVKYINMVCDATKDQIHDILKNSNCISYEIESKGNLNECKIVVAETESTPNFVQSFVQNGVNIYSVAPHNPSLEDIYFATQQKEEQE
jgi:ABC-2 type transport system ATP-binding protein